MSFTAHLEELRSRLIKCFLALIAAFLGCFSISEFIFSILTAPLLSLEVQGLGLIGTGVSEAFFVKIKVAFVGSVFLSVFFGTFFFLLGAWFCYEVIFRVGYGFLLKTYESIDVRPAIRISEYLTFSSKLLLAFGVVFELPVLAFFLARIGLIDHHFLIRQFRYAILVIFCLAAVLTPPDIVSQVLLALPLTGLYSISIVVAYFARRKGGSSSE